MKVIEKMESRVLSKKSRVLHAVKMVKEIDF